MCTDWMEIERKREPNTVCDTSSHRIEIERKREPNTVYNTCVCLIGTHRMCEHVSHTVLGSRFLSVSIQSVHIQCANIHSSNVWTYTRIIHCVGLSLSFYLHLMRTCILHCVGHIRCVLMGGSARPNAWFMSTAWLPDFGKLFYVLVSTNIQNPFWRIKGFQIWSSAKDSAVLDL